MVLCGLIGNTFSITSHPTSDPPGLGLAHGKPGYARWIHVDEKLLNHQSQLAQRLDFVPVQRYRPFLSGKPVAPVEQLGYNSL